jgi:hypothetical protein
MIARRLALMLALGVSLTAPTVRAAEPGSQPDVRVVQLQTIYLEAQKRVDLYNSTRDPKHLVVAKELLLRWLDDHATLYGPSGEAEALRTPIRQQLTMVDTELSRLSAPAPAPAPVSVQPAPAAAEPAPRSVDPEVAAALQEADRYVRGGTAAFTVGAITLLGVGLPLWAARNTAVRKASVQDFRVDEERWRERARRRQIATITTFSVGTPLVLLGTALITVGLAKRGQARRRMAVLPQLGPGLTGASLTLRF